MRTFKNCWYWAISSEALVKWGTFRDYPRGVGRKARNGGQLDMNSEKLNELVEFARNWFTSNGVDIPKTAAEWQKCSVARGEIPPGCTTGSLRRLGTTAKWFIESILGKDNPTSIKKVDMDYAALGFKLIDHSWYKGHKSCDLECIQCCHKEVIDFGTLARMRDRGDKFCRICRNVGGKPKPIHVYNRPGFVATEYSNHIVTLRHELCGNTITRTTATLANNAVPVCEHCYPEKNSVFGTKVTLDGITFHSKVEADVYSQLKVLATEFNFTITRQIPYATLFSGVSSNHTADFFIPEYSIVVEAGGLNTARYKETMAWKLSLSDRVCHVPTANQVDDIVRPLLKRKG